MVAAVATVMAVVAAMLALVEVVAAVVVVNEAAADGFGVTPPGQTPEHCHPA